MIGRAHRFHGFGSLRPVYQRGQSLRGPLMNLRFIQRDPRRPYRVAVVVSRKVHKSAVVRNRIRRRIYESVRRTGIELPGGLDMVFTVFSDQVAELPPTKLQSTVETLLKKATKQQLV
jgi:ribonuclease P protein component